MAAVDDYQLATETLADQTDRQTQMFYTGLLAGTLSRAGAVAKIVAAVNRANASAVALGDVYVSSAIEELSLEPTPTIGVLPVDDSERLFKAADTIFTEPDAQDMRLSRLSRSEPFETAQRAAGEAMAKQPMVEGWTRHFDADPCELCLWWWRAGKVWPKDYPFQNHKGCNCQPRIVLVDSIKPTNYTRRLRRA